MVMSTPEGRLSFLSSSTVWAVGNDRTFRRVCTELGRVSQSIEITALLDRAAKVLTASGDPGPVLIHNSGQPLSPEDLSRVREEAKRTGRKRVTSDGRDVGYPDADEPGWIDHESLEVARWMADGEPSPACCGPPPVQNPPRLWRDSLTFDGLMRFGGPEGPGPPLMGLARPGAQYAVPASICRIRSSRFLRLASSGACGRARRA